MWLLAADSFRGAFDLTIAKSVVENANPKKSNEGIKRVLVYRLGSLGDTVVSLPCLHLIAGAYKNATRVMITNIPINGKAAPASSVIGNSGLIHDYICYPVGTRSVRKLARLFRQVASFRADVLIYLMQSRPTASVLRDLLFFKLCGVRTIVGVPKQRSTHLYNSETRMYESEASRLARGLRDIGDACVPSPKSWDLCLSNEEKAEATTLLGREPGPFICCAIGTKQDAKDWGAENWRSLFTKLHKYCSSYSLVLIGAPEERGLSDTALLGWPGRKINLCGRCSPRISAAVIRCCEMFLGVDSGPMHLAAAVGTPVISVFSGQSKPGIWFPFQNEDSVIFHETSCCGCRLEVCGRENKRCILSITPDEVLRAVVSIQERLNGVLRATGRDGHSEAVLSAK